MADVPTTVKELVQEYAAFEKQVTLRQAEPGLENLVRFSDNKTSAIHGWFSFKEGFSADLLRWLCESIPLDLNELGCLLDPFCGVGTSLLAAQLPHRGNSGLHAYGVEYNPFLRFVAQAKLAWPQYRPHRIEKLIPRLLAPWRNKPCAEYPVPGLSTIRNPKVFDPSVVQELLAYRDRIRTELHGEPEETFFLLGWAAIIERVSGVRRDGRALRFKGQCNLPAVTEALRDQWQAMLDDLYYLAKRGVSPPNVSSTVLGGDGRSLSLPELCDRTFDLILYSPPYLNNIDHSEVYKLELWLGGFINSQEEFRALRRGTVRSHPSIRFPDTDLLRELPDDSWPVRLQESLLAALPKNKDLSWRMRMIKGYMDDMYQALSAQFRAARPNAPVVCVVGNSLHGRRDHPVPVATDLLISALAQAIGFRIEWLQVARQLRRRDHGNELLRESIILMRRPRN